MSAAVREWRVFEGDLYDGLRLVRRHYARQWATISTGFQVRAALRAGPYAWPGGYALAFVMDDGEAMCFRCVRENFRQIAEAMRRPSDWPACGWGVDGIASEESTDDAATCCQCDRTIWEAKV